ncbi:MAG: hypothetical protein H7Z40_05540 [Phycisphaerae bacterium]|nr:hypothetical protein [Gemmatimonadaceae bacterium]
MAQQTVALEVQFALVTPENKPVSGAPIRLVLGEQAGWQTATTGTRFTTNAEGKHNFSTQAVVSEKRRKMPTNFLTSLFARAEVTQHFSVAVELPYAGRPWLYAATSDYFTGGTSARMDVMRVFGANASGAFTVPAAFSEGAYSLPGIPGTMAIPGHDVLRFAMEPGSSGTNWKLFLTIVRYPEPRRR